MFSGWANKKTARFDTIPEHARWLFLYCDEMREENGATNELVSDKREKEATVCAICESRSDILRGKSSATHARERFSSDDEEETVKWKAHRRFSPLAFVVVPPNWRPATLFLFIYIFSIRRRSLCCCFLREACAQSAPCVKYIIFLRSLYPKPYDEVLLHSSYGSWSDREREETEW